MDYTDIRFNRSSHIETSRAIAILSLDEAEQKVGQPIIVRYYTDASQTTIDTIFAIGVKSGVGRDCYRFITLGQRDILWKVLYELPDVSSLVHDQTYAYGDENGDWFYVYLEGNERQIEPLDSKPHIFYCVEDNSIWVSGEDRKLRCLNNIMSKEEMDLAISQMRLYVENTVAHVVSSADRALAEANYAVSTVNTLNVEVENMKADADWYKYITDDSIEEIVEALANFKTEYGDVIAKNETTGKVTINADFLNIQQSAKVAGSNVANQQYVDASVAGSQRALQDEIDDVNDAIDDLGDAIGETQRELHSFASFNDQDGAILDVKFIAASNGTVGGSTIATLQNVQDAGVLIGNQIAALSSSVDTRFDDTADDISELDTRHSGEIDALDDRTTASEGDIDVIEEWKALANPVLRDLDNKSLPIVASITGSIAREYTGQEYTATLNWNFKRDGVEVNPTTLLLTKDGAQVTTDASLKTYNVTGSKKGSTVFTLSGTYTDILQTKTAAPVTASITTYLPKYIGHSLSTEISASDIVGMVKQGINGTTSGTYVVTTESDYAWFCFPAEFAEVRGMKASGFDFSYLEPQIVEVQIAGATYNYRCYRSANLLNGSWTVVIS